MKKKSIPQSFCTAEKEKEGERPKNEIVIVLLYVNIEIRISRCWLLSCIRRWFSKKWESKRKFSIAINTAGSSWLYLAIEDADSSKADVFFLRVLR